MFEAQNPTIDRHDVSNSPITGTDNLTKGVTSQMQLLTDTAVVSEEILAKLPCRAFDAELFFAESPEDVEYAKSLCQYCPIRTGCLAGAKERAEPWGVWGGELFVQGIVVPRKRPRGRPRKNPVAA